MVVWPAVLVFWRIWSTSRLNRDGLREEPWGVPSWKLRGSDVWPANLTDAVRFLR